MASDKAFELEEAMRQAFGGLSEEDCAEIGYNFGRRVAAFIAGFACGLTETREDQPEAQAAPADPSGNPEVKTNIADCRACWCDTCAVLEDCTMIREGFAPDGLRPLPCVGCKNGLRSMPREREPSCGRYAEIEGHNNG